MTFVAGAVCEFRLPVELTKVSVQTDMPKANHQDFPSEGDESGWTEAQSAHSPPPRWPRVFPGL